MARRVSEPFGERADAARALRLVMQAHRAVPGMPATEPAPVHVITPYNIPSPMTA